MSSTGEERTCRRSTDPELWFSTRRRDQERAKTLCRSCKAAATCLEETLETERNLGHTLHGIFAGTTEQERQQVLTKLSA